MDRSSDMARPQLDFLALIALPLRLHEVGLIGDKDPPRRVEHQELARHLRQTVAGHGDHRLADQAETLLLHDGGDHRERLSRANGVGNIRAASRDDPPDHPLLVAAQTDRGAGARRAEMGAVELPRHEVVAGIVIQPDQPLCPVAVLPDPCLESTPDRREFFLCGFRFLRGQLAILIAVNVAPDLPDLW